jgi:hypothetical protein
VIIPNSVTSLGGWAWYGDWGCFGDGAFSGCTSLRGVYFEGNAPSLDEGVFSGANATVYYVPGTTGWGPTFGGRPTALWFPHVQPHESTFGVQSNRFGFTISWASDKVVVVEAATDLTRPTWTAVSTNTLAGGSSYFSDPQWADYPRRFYRVRAR